MSAASNFSIVGSNFTIPDSEAVQVDATEHVFKALTGLDIHDHSSGLGTGVKRLQTTVAPAAAGEVRVNTDDVQWWGSSAAAIQTAVRTAGNQTIAGNKTFSNAMVLSSSLTVGNSLVVSAGGANVTGNATFNNNVTVSGTLDATGAATLASTLGVTGAATLASYLAFSTNVAGAGQGRIWKDGTGGLNLQGVDNGGGLNTLSLFDHDGTLVMNVLTGRPRFPTGLNANGNSSLGAGASTVGFFGSAGTTKPTVSGAKGGNAALGSLMTALAGMGLVADSTSA